jgi:hypothetical protein
MRIGLREILLAIAIVLFIVAALSNSNPFDYLAYGLACLAGALLVGELGLAGGMGKRR